VVIKEDIRYAEIEMASISKKTAGETI